MSFRTWDIQQGRKRPDMQEQEVPLASLPTSKLTTHHPKSTGTIYCVLISYDSDTENPMDKHHLI